MKRTVTACLAAVLSLSPFAEAYEARKAWGLGLHYPGFGLRYYGPGKYSGEFRFATSDGISLYGGRVYRLMREYKGLNLYIAGETDLILFQVDKYDVQGLGLGAGIFGCAEKFLSDKFSVGLDMGPGYAYVKNTKAGSPTGEFGIVVNFFVNWIFKGSLDEGQK